MLSSFGDYEKEKFVVLQKVQANETYWKVFSKSYLVDLQYNLPTLKKP